MIEFPLTIKGSRIELITLEPTFDNARLVFDTVVENREHLLPWLTWSSIERTNKPEDSFEFLLKNKQKREEHIKYSFGIFLNDKYIGNVGIFDISEKKKSAEIVYWLIKEAVGKGYISEAVKLIEDEAFSNLGLNRIQIRCDVRNTASANVAKRLGYKLDGTMRSFNFNRVENIFVDCYIFSKLKLEWEVEGKKE